MDTCDVLIVGGGPAGSACASHLTAAGLDVVIVDRAVFPRDKVCAGWITPQVVTELHIDPDDYRRGRTFQPITGFRVGVTGEDRSVEAEYGHPVSYGIRRCEFDAFLLHRSGARRRLGAQISRIRRDGHRWTIDDAVAAPMLVGAGGHFCPVARLLNGPADRAPLVAAQEVELPLDAQSAPACRVRPEQPELYFCADLSGYGWCFRKGDFLNVGFGHVASRGLPKATAAFVNFLQAAGRIGAPTSPWRWRGHAYLLSGSSGRRAVADGVMLAGDAAGLAYPQSGEGIRPAIESGLLAAAAIVAANGDYRRERLAPYEQQLRRRFGAHPIGRVLSQVVPVGMPAAWARWLLDRPWFVRRIVLDRWFLHAGDSALALS